MFRRNIKIIFVFLFLGCISLNFGTRVENSEMQDNKLQMSQVSDSITITNPTDSTSWETSSEHTVTWTSTGDMDHLVIELYLDNDYCTDIATLANNDGSYKWFIPDDLKSSSKYQVKITHLFQYSLNDYSDYFEIYTYVEPEPPADITIITPNSSSSWDVGTTQSITWTSTGNVNNVAIDLYQGDIYLETISIGTSNDGSYNWVIPSHLGEANTYQLLTSDFINLSISDYSDYFTITNDIIINDAPEITILTPTSNITWKQGNQYLIEWGYDGGSPNFDTMVLNLYKGDQNVMAIVEQEYSYDHYSFVIPETVGNGDDFQ